MMSSGSTVFFFDFDIFSIEPISIGSPVDSKRRAARVALAFDLDFGRLDPFAVLCLVGLVHHHALREQAGERLVDVEMAGLSHGAGEETRIEQMQNRVLDAADILIDRQPPVGALSAWSAPPFHGSVKRAKYQDESTKVSMVSVSRGAGAPHCGHLTFFQVGWRSSGLPGLSKLTSSGSITGRSFAGTGTTPHFSQWMTGIGQPQ